MERNVLFTNRGMGLGDIMGLMDSLFGKTKTYKADPIAAKIKSLGMQGADLQKKSLMSLGDAQGMAQKQTNLQEKLAQAAGEDEQRAVAEMAAKRGLRGTSQGLALESGAARRTAENIQNIRANKESLARKFGMENFNLGSQLISQRGPIRMNKLKVKQPGLFQKLAPAAGMIAGAALGGPAGASFGEKLGSEGGSRGAGIGGAIGQALAGF